MRYYILGLYVIPQLNVWYLYCTTCAMYIRNVCISALSCAVGPSLTLTTYLSSRRTNATVGTRDNHKLREELRRATRLTTEESAKGEACLKTSRPQVSVRLYCIMFTVAGARSYIDDMTRFMSKLLFVCLRKISLTIWPVFAPLLYAEHSRRLD